jgi:proteasome accessory factor A
MHRVVAAGGLFRAVLEAVMTRDSDFKKLVRQRMAVTGQSYTAARATMYRPVTEVDLPLPRRAFGLKTPYAAAFDGGQAPGGAGAGERLFRQLIAGGTGMGVFLENGAWFGLRPAQSDVAQPAYATPECDSIVELVAAQYAGDEIVARLAARARESLASEGSPATLAVSRAEAAQSESYLIAAAVAPERYLRLLEPFLATRWIYGGTVYDGTVYGGPVHGGTVALPVPQAALAPGSFADDRRYRRLKITGPSASLSQLATFVTAGATEQVLRLAESSASTAYSVRVPADHRDGVRDAFSVDAPAANAVRTQRAYLAAARRIRHRRPEDDIVLDAWQAALDAYEDRQDLAGTPIATAAQIDSAVDLPPQTTRARLRGLFIKTAKEHRRSFVVDWPLFKLYDSEGPTVLCRDPLNANVEIAQRLIASISGTPA